MCGAVLGGPTETLQAYMDDIPVPTFAINATKCVCLMTREEKAVCRGLVSEQFKAWLSKADLTEELVVRAKSGSTAHVVHTKYKQTLRRLAR